MSRLLSQGYMHYCLFWHWPPRSIGFTLSSRATLVLNNLHSCQLTPPPLEGHTPHRAPSPPQDHHPPAGPPIKNSPPTTHNLLNNAKQAYFSTKSCYKMPKSTKKKIQYMYILHFCLNWEILYVNSMFSIVYYSINWVLMVRNGTNVWEKGHHALWPPTTILSGGSSPPPPTTLSKVGKYESDLCSQGYYYFCLLWPWRLTSDKFDQNTIKGLIYIVFTMLNPLLYIVTLTFESIWPPNSKDSSSCHG